jgi:integrase
LDTFAVIMSRTVKEANLSTRAARTRLEPSGKPYFRALDEGLHLGYRKGARGAAWVVRWYAGDEAYKVETLDGRPDDVLEADGETVLTWPQAQAAARQLFQKKQRVAAGLDEVAGGKGPYTVRHAMEDYLAHMASTKKTAKATAGRAGSMVLPVLGDIDAAKLSADRIRRWLVALANAPILRRGKRLAVDHDDPEAVRRRRSSANRVLTILKAALNHAWREGKIASNTEWSRVKPFAEADAARVRYLSIDEAMRLLAACEADLRQLVHGALTTGGRFGELAAMVVADYNQDNATVHIRLSKSGKPRHVVLNGDGAALFAGLCAGRSGAERIFQRADGRAWVKDIYQRPFKEACRRAGINPAITFHELRHTWASLSIMAGAPLMVVAQNLGHADSRMVEKHYGHLTQSYVADTIRRTAPSFSGKPPAGE